MTKSQPFPRNGPRYRLWYWREGQGRDPERLPLSTWAFPLEDAEDLKRSIELTGIRVEIEEV